jgi:hypothetical protein
MRDLARHYDGFGPSPFVLSIAGNALSGAFGLLSACRDYVLLLSSAKHVPL